MGKSPRFGALNPQPNQATVKHMLSPVSPPNKAGNAGWYPAQATTREKQILRPSHSPSVKRNFPSVIRRRQWGPLGIRMRRGGTPVEWRNRPPFDGSLNTVRDVGNKYHGLKIRQGQHCNRNRSLWASHILISPAALAYILKDKEPQYDIH